MLVELVRRMREKVSVLQGFRPNEANAIDYRRAEGHFLAVARRRPEFAGVHVNLGELDKWRDRLSAALEHFRRAHELDPELSPAVCNLAGGLATLGRGGEALGILGEYRRRHPEDEVAERLEGDVRRAFGR